MPRTDVEIFLAAQRAEFEARLATATGWGRNQVKEAYEAATQRALLALLAAKQDKEKS